MLTLPKVLKNILGAGKIEVENGRGLFCECDIQSKGQLIKFWKQIFLFWFEPKNEQNYFLISALASKNGSNQKN